MHIDKDMKKSFMVNTIKLVIGAILLGFSYMYLQAHEAEKTAVFSWFRVMYQRISVYRAKYVNNNDDILKEKYTLDMHFKQLLKNTTNNTCLPAEIISDLHMTYDNFNKETTVTLPNTYSSYIEKIQYFKTQLDRYCEQ